MRSIDAAAGLALTSVPARGPWRWYRPAMVGLSVVLVTIGAGIFYFATRAHDWAMFDDLRIYVDATHRLLAGESWYLARQVAGPYALTHGDVLYPPVTAWFILPWLVLPPVAFVVAPVAVLGWFVVRCRPAPWTWPIIAGCAVYPTTLVYVVYANPTLWIAVFAALGLRFRWPGVLILLKPSLAPFALIGIRSRGWWIGFAILALASLPVLAGTLAYPRVLLDAQGGGLLYSLPQVPLMLIPVVAWIGRSVVAGQGWRARLTTGGSGWGAGIIPPGP
jgi:hypothetical protein